MRKHKLEIMAGILTVVIIAAITGILLAREAQATTGAVSAQVPERYLAATPRNLEYLGLAFSRVEVGQSQARGAISRDQAVADALQEDPQLKIAHSVSAMLGLLRNTNLQNAASRGVMVNPHLADMGLVWLVTFHGVVTSSSGPAESPRYVSNEYTVVIDAKTGTYIMAFPLYDVTPNAAPMSTVMPGGPLESTSLPNVTPSVAPTAIP